MLFADFLHDERTGNRRPIFFERTHHRDIEKAHDEMERDHLTAILQDLPYSQHLPELKSLLLDEIDEFYYGPVVRGASRPATSVNSNTRWRPAFRPEVQTRSAAAICGTVGVLLDYARQGYIVSQLIRTTSNWPKSSPTSTAAAMLQDSASTLKGNKEASSRSREGSARNRSSS
jgi:hypothetical protein